VYIRKEKSGPNKEGNDEYWTQNIAGICIGLLFGAMTMGGGVSNVMKNIKDFLNGKGRWEKKDEAPKEKKKEDVVTKETKENRNIIKRKK